MGFKQWLIYILRSLLLPGSLKTMEWKMLRLLNKDRKAYNFKPLFMQNDLRVVARKHSKDMARKDYFEHENLTGKSHADRFKEAQISDVVSGENLAKIGGYAHPVHRAEVGLMNSPGHRANILNAAYNCVGVGIHKSEKKVYYYTQNFAHRDLIFSKNPPQKTRIKKGLTLNFRPVGKLKLGVYRVLDNSGVIKEKGFPIHQGNNRLHITFSTPGKYTVQLFTGAPGSTQLKISNEITVRVRKGWF